MSVSGIAYYLFAEYIVYIYIYYIMDFLKKNIRNQNQTLKNTT